MPLLTHLAFPAGIDQPDPDQGEQREGAEQQHMGQIAVGQDMDKRPKPDGQ